MTAFVFLGAFYYVSRQTLRGIDALLIVHIDRAMVTPSLMLLSFILSIDLIQASHAKDPAALKFGKCDPAGAVKTLDTGLRKGKSLNDSMTIVIQSKQFDGSNSCITFIREASMDQREIFPYAFKKLWME